MKAEHEVLVFYTRWYEICFNLLIIRVKYSCDYVIVQFNKQNISQILHNILIL